MMSEVLVGAKFIGIFAILFMTQNCKVIKNEDKSDTKDTREKFEDIAADYQNAGKCTILDLISEGSLEVDRLKVLAGEAANRLNEARPIWIAIAEERKKRGTDFVFGRVNDLQTMGYIQPLYLAGIKSDISYSGSNVMDVFQNLTTKAKDEAVKFARSIASGSAQTLSIDQAFKFAFKANNHDPFRAMGYLGAITIWDRWNAENLASKNTGGRNDYTVIPHLMSTIGPGDKTGQIYHFWGFVGLLGANGSFLGSIYGNASTYGYEVAKPILGGKNPDMEDFEIDKKAMAYTRGINQILSERPDRQAAVAQQKRLLCQSKISQSTNTVANDDRRSCEIWLGNANSKSDAETQVEQLLKIKADSYLFFEDVTSCAISAKQAPSTYAFKRLANGKSPNFSYMRYGGTSDSKRIAIYSSAWLGDGFSSFIRPDSIPERCKAANRIGGDCSSLAQVVKTELCPKPSEYAACVKEEAVAIDFYLTVYASCLNSKPKTCGSNVGDVTANCYFANKQGGTCGNLKRICAGAFCNASSSQYSSCLQNNKFQIDSCLARDQYCLSNERDQCIPLSELNKYSMPTIW
jgi:hypothetical protein